MRAMILQAIQTKFLGPTNTRPSRIRATAAAGSIAASSSLGDIGRGLDRKLRGG